MQWLAAQAGSLGLLLVQFLLTVVIAAVMYSGGETAAAACPSSAHRLGGPAGRGRRRAGGAAIRGVALGVVVTALVQTMLGGIGLLVAGVPFAGLLTAVMLMLCLAQIGPGLVLVPAVIWLYWTGATGWGTVLLVWSCSSARWTTSCGRS